MVNFISPEGGSVIGIAGSMQVTLQMPAGTVSEPVRVNINAASTPPATGGFLLLGQVFEVTAQTAGGMPVT
jgi:hypothetical protein